MEQNTHTRLIQDWINLETEVEQEHLRPPLCRWAAKSFCLLVRRHMKRKFPMSCPDEDSRRREHAVHWLLQKHVHFYIKHLRCIETAKASGKRRGYTLDRTLVRYGTHAPYTHTWRLGKIHGSMERIISIQYRTQYRTVTRNLVLYYNGYCANHCTTVPYSLYYFTRLWCTRKERKAKI